MRKILELNATCQNCKFWQFETEDGMDFLEDEECYCGLTNKQMNPEDECEKLELEINSILISQCKVNR